MRRALRWLLTGILLIAVMIVAAGLTALYGASPHQIQRVALDSFTDATGLVLKIDGGFEPVLAPVPGWRIGAITIGDPDAAEGDPPLLQAQDAWLTLAPEGLLQGTFRIGALHLEKAQITLPVAAGEALDFDLPSRTPPVSFLRLHDAEISIGAPGTEGYQHARLEFASLDYAGAKRPMRFAMQGVWRNRKIDAAARITSPDRIIRGDWVFAEAQAQIEGDAVTYSGRLKPDFSSEMPTLAGNLTARIANPAGALSWLMQAPPNDTLINLRDLTLESRVETLPDRMLVRTRWAGDYFGKRISLDATLRGDADWRASGTGSLNAVARAGGLFSSYLNGSFARDQGISGDLSISVLDFPGMFDAQILPPDYRLTDAKNGSVKGRLSATTQGFALADTTLLLGNKQYTGDAAIDLRSTRAVISLGTEIVELNVDQWVDPVLHGQQPLTRILPNLDADLVLEVNAETVRYQGSVAGPMTVSISTQPDALVLDLRRLDFAGGVIAGSLRTTPTSNIAKLDLTGAEIDSAQLLGQFGLSGVDGILGGSLQAEIPFPPSVEGWNSMKAEGTASLYQARLESIDLRAAEAGPESSSTFAHADIDFAARGTEFNSTRLALRDLPGNWSGKGTLDISTGKLAAIITSDDVPEETRNLSGSLDAPIITGNTAETQTNATKDQPDGHDSDADDQTTRGSEVTTTSGQASITAPETVGPTQTPRIQQADNAQNLLASDPASAFGVEATERSIAAKPAPTSNAPSAEVAGVSQAEDPAEEAVSDVTGPEASPLPARPKR